MLKKMNTHTMYSKDMFYFYFMCEPKSLQVGVKFVY